MTYILFTVLAHTLLSIKLSITTLEKKMEKQIRTSLRELRENINNSDHYGNGSEAVNCHCGIDSEGLIMISYRYDTGDTVAHIKTRPYNNSVHVVEIPFSGMPNKHMYTKITGVLDGLSRVLSGEGDK